MNNSLLSTNVFAFGVAFSFSFSLIPTVSCDISCFYCTKRIRKKNTNFLQFTVYIPVCRSAMAEATAKCHVNKKNSR